MQQLHTCLLKVRTYECDLYGHVNNATYLNYLEYARMDFLHEKGLTLPELQKEGVMLVVARIDCQYKVPAFPEDNLQIETYLEDMRNTSGIFKQIIKNTESEKIVVEAKVVWVATNLKGKPIAIPDVIKNINRI